MNTSLPVTRLPEELHPRSTKPAGLRRLVGDIVASPGLWSDHVRFDLYERYFLRLHHEDAFEVWLICWEMGQDTLLHDHGGSSGAFAMARGTLVEDHSRLGGSRLHTRCHREGEAVAFGPTYLHNLVNTSTEPAVSVHAYARPLHTMNFYCWLPSGPHHLREIACDSPEPETGDLERVAERVRAVSR